MSDAHTAMWWVLGVLGVLAAALFSGLETGIYSLNRVRLHVRATHPRSAAGVILRMAENPNRLLTTLLVGSSGVNYLASIALGAILEDAGYRGWALVGVDVAILTPVLVIAGEIVPKDLFRSHADVLVYPFAWPLRGLERVLTWAGVLPLVGWVTEAMHGLIMSREEAIRVASPRRVVRQLLREGAGQGLISRYQSEMIDRSLQMNRVTVGDVMVGWREAVVVRASRGAEAVWQLADRVPFTRVPLVDGSGRVMGLIDVGAVLRHRPEACPPLTTLAKPLPEVGAGASLRQALVLLQQRRSSMAVVMEGGRAVGLVTTKDLLEPLIGEVESF